MRRTLSEFARSPVFGRTGRSGPKAGPRAIALWLTVVSASAAPACYLGGQSGDPGQLQPATGGNPGATTGGSGSGGEPSLKTGGNGYGPLPIEPCEGQDWSGPEAQRHQGSCTRVDYAQWQCECDGVTRSVASESCGEALLDGCNIDVGAPTYCAAAPAECWPGNDNGTLWRCRCAETDGLQEIEARSCGEALNARCGVTCEDALGACRQDLVDYYDVGFECGCRASSEGAELSNLKPAIVPSGARLSCSETLALTCRSRCANAAGYCLYSYETGAYGCNCSDGSFPNIVPDPSVAVDPLNPATFPEDACYQVLARGCGELVYPTASMCSSSYGDAAGSCEPQPTIVKAGEAVSEETRFACTCGPDATGDAGSVAGATGSAGASATDVAQVPSVVSAPSCHAALQTACPGSIRPSD